MTKVAKNFHELRVLSPSPDTGKSLIQIADANFSQHFGLKRLGIHHVTLQPGFRTSYPHAESLEEEFVFVISGTPHAWINGFLYPLQPGWALGFPAGTGIAHSFINNSYSDVHLLVVGERTKKENLCSFPINSELKATSEIWWPDYPTQEFGPHNGLPGPIETATLRTDHPAFAIFAPGLERRKPFHYPGDNETFGYGVRLTDPLSLKALGIWFEELLPGRRSSFPHAHTHEEEFAFILEGHPTVWLNGNTESLAPGDGIAFVPNSGVAHCLINDTDQSVFYIGIGETQDFPEEKITYPMNPLRNKECLRKNWFWTDAPKFPFGSHNGNPKRGFQDHLKFRLCAESAGEEVLKIFETSPDYFLKVNGCPPTLKTATHEIVDGPKKTIEAYFKEFLIIEMNGEPIGVVDLHCNHPEQGITYLGLLLISEHLSGKGIGKKCFFLAEDYIRRSFGSKIIRLGVSDDNDVSGFWKSVGFIPNRKTYSWKGEAKTTNVVEYDKILDSKEIAPL